MSKYGVIIAWLLLVPGIAAGPSHAAPADQNALYSGIAACLGRYAAQVEHGHLMGQSTDGTAERHSEFNRLYDALEGNSQLLSLRIAQKAHHARLLQIATFNTDPRRRTMAARQAQSQIASCNRMMLS